MTRAPASARQVGRAVGAAAVDDEELVGPGDRGEARLDVAASLSVMTVTVSFGTGPTITELQASNGKLRRSGRGGPLTLGAGARRTEVAATWCPPHAGHGSYCVFCTRSNVMSAWL